MICFYHRADLDGHCCAAILRRAFPEAELVGIDYGDEFPWPRVRDQDVIMADFSLEPFDGMVRLQKEARSFLWIDHHKSSIDDYMQQKDVIIRGNLNVKLAACELCWQSFMKTPMPRGVRLLGRYDVWDHKADVAVLPFQYGMRLEDTAPESKIWNVLFGPQRKPKVQRAIERIIEYGVVVMEYQRQSDEKLCAARAFEAEIDGLKVIAVNKALTNSKVFDSVYDPECHDAMVAFSWLGGKGLWTVSLYTTREDVDVGEVAKAHGGGGHKGAAGFQCKELPEGFLR